MDQAAHTLADTKRTADGKTEGAVDPGITVAVAAADALLEALRSPMTLEWSVPLDGGGRARLFAEISQFEVAPTFSLRIAPGGRPESEISLPRAITTEELAALFAAASEPEAGSDAASQQAYAQDAPQSVARPGDALPIILPETMLPKVSSRVEIIATDKPRGVFQPRCLHQWHDSVCGHHALYSISCLLEGRLTDLMDEQRFWQTTFGNIRDLAAHGEDSELWPRSRVTGGVADEHHLRHLISRQPALHGRVSMLSHGGVLKSQQHELHRKDVAEALQALDEIRSGSRQAHGFVLGATNHWYAAVAFAPTGAGAGPELWFCDSYNKPLAQLRSNEDVERLVDERLEWGRSWLYKKLRQSPEWTHRPEAHLAQVYNEGVEEWWKGICKSSVFWRIQPLAVRKALKQQELSEVQAHLRDLVSSLGSHSAEGTLGARDGE